MVIGMGTGGTVTGVGRFLKEKNPEIRIVGIDPVGSILRETWEQGRVPEDAQATTYKVEGIGEDFLPSTLDLSVIDQVLQVSDKESFLWARRLVKAEGIFCGGSSGTALAGAIRYIHGLGHERLDDGALVVVILPDTGSRYLSKLYDDKWMRENGFLETAWSEVTLQEILESKPERGLISAQLNDRIPDVIRRMKEHDISQMPVLGPEDRILGLVTEIDLLKYCLLYTSDAADE